MKIKTESSSCCLNFILLLSAISGDKHFSRACCGRTRSNGFTLKEGRFILDIRKKFLYNEVGETLARVAQRGGRCPIPANIPGQA